jgi:hypothetical protein
MIAATIPNSIAHFIIKNNKPNRNLAATNPTTTTPVSIKAVLELYFFISTTPFYINVKERLSRLMQ